jgi:glycosyltransferase involved in cell wall biosynthesis
MGDALQFTVCTATRDRAHILPDAYECLRAQTCRSFEWIVVDDGSRDSTGELVRGWQQEADFPIRLIRHEGKGKHVALNAGVSIARGELFAILDSDDVCAAQTLERFWYHWRTMSNEQQARFSTITGLCRSPDGRILGGRFASDVLDVEDFATQFRLRQVADRWGVNRTELLRRYPFPTYPNETFLPEALVWNRLSASYAARFVNEVFLTARYQRGGLSASSVKLRATNPRGTRQYYLELAAYRVPLGLRMKACVNYSRFSAHARLSPVRAIRESQALLLTALAAPAGQIMAAVDRWQLRRAADAGLPADERG